VAEVKQALELRNLVRAFALDTQYLTAPDLHARFQQDFPA